MSNNYSQGVPEFMAYGGIPVGIPAGAVPQHATNGAVPQWSLGQNNDTILPQVIGATIDMTKEYFKMKNHGYKNLDDYYHCKANYNAASRGPGGYNTAKFLGDIKEEFDFYKNKLYKGLSEKEAIIDKQHDLAVNAIGRIRGDSGLYNSAMDACAEYRMKNPSFPSKYW